MSESLTITSTFPGQAQAASSAAGPALRTAQYSQGISQRGDERASLTLKSLKRGDLVDKSLASAKPYLNLEALKALPRAPDSFDGDTEGSGDASEPDDSSHRRPIEIDYLAAQESMQNAAAVGAGMSGTLMVGTFALTIVQSPTTSRRRRKVSVLFVSRAARDVVSLRVWLTVVAVVFATISAMVINSPEAAGTVFGTDYRELVTTTGATNTGTSVSISTAGAANYIVDPYNTDSTLTGTPSSSTPSGYGWRTPGVQGQVIPAGTWTFTVETNTSGVTLGTGTAFVRVYAYSTDTLGGNVQSVGTVTGTTDLLTTLGGTQSHTLTFSASETDLTNRVLVVEYWIIVTSPPLLAATAAFHTVSSVTSVQLPTSPTTTYYLATPQLHSMGIDDSITTTDSASRFYDAFRSVSDGVAVTDSINFHVTRSVSDGITISEQIVPRISRFPSDNIAITDELAINVVRPLPESTTITDSISRTYLAGRSASDGIAVTDTPAVRVTRPVQDALAVADDISAKVTARAIADTIPISDDIVAKVTARAIPDSITISDSLSAKVTARAVADSLGITDGITKSVNRQVADNVGITDTVSHRVSRSASDSVGVTDTIAAAVNRPMSASDNVGVTDSITKSVSKATSDTIAVTDSAARTMDASRLASETLSVTDSISVIRTVQSAASDTVGVTDAVSAARGVSGSPSDTVSISDSITKSVTRSTDDSITFTDSISINIAVSKLISEGTSITDSIATKVSRQVSEAVSPTDSVTSAFMAGRTPSDTLTVGDSASRTYAATKTSQDTIALTDGISVNIARSGADTLGVSDSIETTSGKQREMSDSVAVTDGVAVHVNKSAADAVTVSDDITKIMVASRSPSESVAVTDSIEAHRAYSVTIVDAIAIADTPSTSRNVSISDTITISPAIQIETPLLNLGDSLTVSDTVSGLVVKERAVGDGLTIGDTVVAGHQVTINDSVTVTVALTDVSWARTLNLTEQLTLSGDACTPVECAFNLHLGESLALQDAWVSPPVTADTISVSDSIALTATLAREVSDDVTVTDESKTTILTQVSSSGGGRGGGTPVDVTTYPELYFRVNPLAKVQLQNIAFTSIQDHNISEAKSGQQVNIAVTFKNYQRIDQGYAVIVQIADSNGFTADIGWTEGKLTSGQTAQVARSWIPTESGMYRVQMFVWDGVSGAPTPLSEVAEQFFRVT